MRIRTGAVSFGMALVIGVVWACVGCGDDGRDSGDRQRSPRDGGNGAGSARGAAGHHTPTTSTGSGAHVTTAPSRVGLAPRQIEAAEAAGVPSRIEVDLGRGVRMVLVLIPPGAFLMGAPLHEEMREDDEPPHMVTLSAPVYLGATEVTQRQYERVTGANPSRYVGPDRPVERVSWHEASAFCRRLTEAERSSGRLRDGEAYALPTEAVWECACRAGTTAPFNLDGPLNTDRVNYDGHYLYGEEHKLHEAVWRHKTTPVATFAPNPWGLWDMHGNVWEWCADWYGPYATTAVADPAGPASGVNRVLRGGSWFDSPGDLRSANRTAATPDNQDGNIGFRVMRTVAAR